VHQPRQRLEILRLECSDRTRDRSEPTVAENRIGTTENHGNNERVRREHG
jgi:hypothetical protein